MEIYNHTQRSKLFMLLAVFVIWMVFHDANSEDIGRPGTVAILIIIGLIWYFFASLTVNIDNERVRVYFGPGLIGKNIPFKDIAFVSQFRTTIATGWGIRRIRGGWIYNVSGFDAVKLELKDGKSFAIGTDEPNQLAAAIKQALEIQRSMGGNRTPEPINKDF